MRRPYCFGAFMTHSASLASTVRCADNFANKSRFLGSVARPLMMAHGVLAQLFKMRFHVFIASHHAMERCDYGYFGGCSPGEFAHSSR